MENLYTKKQKEAKQVKASAETIKFLLDYSKSLHISKAKGIDIESNLN